MKGWENKRMHEEKWKSYPIISKWLSDFLLVLQFHDSGPPYISWWVGKFKNFRMSSQKPSHPILRSACCQLLPAQPVACCHAQWVLRTSRWVSYWMFKNFFPPSQPWIYLYLQSIIVPFRTLLYWQIKSVPTKMSSLFLLFKSSTWTFPHPSQWCLYQGHG